MTSEARPEFVQFLAHRGAQGLGSGGRKLLSVKGRAQTQHPALDLCTMSTSSLHLRRVAAERLPGLVSQQRAGDRSTCLFFWAAPGPAATQPSHLEPSHPQAGSRRRWNVLTTQGCRQPQRAGAQEPASQTHELPGRGPGDPPGTRRAGKNAPSGPGGGCPAPFGNRRISGWVHARRRCLGGGFSRDKAGLNPASLSPAGPDASRRRPEPNGFQTLRLTG